GGRSLREAAMSPGMPLVLAVTLVLGMAIDAAFFFVTPFTRDVGLARSGPFFASYATVSILIRLLGRRTLDVLGPHRVSYPAFAIFGIGLAGLAHLPAPGLLLLSRPPSRIRHAPL